MSSIQAKKGSKCSSDEVASDSSIDFSLVEKEYSGFITFVNETPPPGKDYLTHFLFPFYVYIYLLLLKHQEFTEAQRFLSIYSRLFLKAEGYSEVIQDLCTFKTVEEAQNHSYFKNFCEYKYQVKVSEGSLKLLSKYLEEAECRILSHILHREFNIEVIDYQSGQQITESSSDKPKESSSERTESLEDNSSTRNIDVKRTNNGSSGKIPCYNYTISCGKEQLCCVDINQKNTLLACGFENSEIHVFNTDLSIVKEFKAQDLDANESKAEFNDDNTSSSSLRCILKGHSGGVHGIAYVSGLLMSCSEDATARAWSMTDFKDVRVYSDHKYPIWDITVSSNRVYFATASHDCTARLWSFDRTTPLRIFVGHSSDVDHVRFHSNCRYLATASADKTIQLWAVEDARSVRHFPGHDTYINSIAFSPDGKHIASADDRGCIKIWDLASGNLHSEIVAHSKKILSICYNTDSSLIASCGIDNYIKIWDVKHSSLSADEKGRSEFQAISLIDSYTVDFVPHYVGFRQKDLLISIGTETRTEF